MPRNVEIKARVPDPDELRRRIEGGVDRGPEVLRQRDPFFRVPRGRLKLRELEGVGTELIFYERAEGRDPRPSDYRIAPAADAAPVGALLAAALGEAGVVEKTRLLWLIGPTRVHFDEVLGLGWFLELEVVLHDGLSTQDGERIARDLLERLAIRDEDLLSESYVDLLAGSTTAEDPSRP